MDPLLLSIGRVLQIVAVLCASEWAYRRTHAWEIGIVLVIYAAIGIGTWRMDWEKRWRNAAFQLLNAITLLLLLVLGMAR